MRVRVIQNEGLHVIRVVREAQRHMSKGPIRRQYRFGRRWRWVAEVERVAPLIYKSA